MSDPLRFAFQYGTAPSTRRPDPDQPMRVLVIGNFSGRATDDADRPLAERKLQRIDIDNFDDLLAKIRPSARIPLGAGAESVTEINIGDLDDFHPDQLYRTLPVFQELRDLRKRLMNPDTFAEAAENLRKAVPISEVDPDPEPITPADESNDESDSDTLGRILGRPAALAGDSDRTARVDVSGLINDIVAPHVVPGPDPRQDQYVESVDAAVSAQMRSILRNDAFQTLEAIWSGLHFLITNVETSEELQVFLWDVTPGELTQAFATAGETLEDSIPFRKLVSSREEDPFSIVVSAESFGESSEDLTLLGGLAALASHSGATLIASAAPALLGCQTWSDPNLSAESAGANAEVWQSIRSSPLAPHIGLAAPRVLSRLPYGASTDPIDSFAFEEISDPQTEHEAFQWGSPAFACATLLATSFVDSGWGMMPGDHLELGDLPAATFSVDGEPKLTPCAEFNLPQRTGETILDHGLMPLMSFKNRNAVRVLRFQSVADPPTPLAGGWASSS